jgi:hypothetical protein
MCGRTCTVRQQILHNKEVPKKLRSRVIPVLIAVAVCLIGGLLALPSSLIATAEAQSPAIPAAAAPTVQDADAPLQQPDVTPQQPEAEHVPTMAEPQMVNIDAAMAAGVSRPVLNLALGAVQCAIDAGDVAAPPTLTVIDYSRPSTEPRLWVFDLRTGDVRYRELVAHGKGTGENLAQHFSDNMNSHQSSLGLFVTRDTYVGNNGYSLRLEGLEPGFNSRARERAIVMHGAPYVNAEFAAKQGRLGRSWGCPAVRDAVARQIIDFVRDGGVIFSYYPDEAWLNRSRFLNCTKREPELRAASITQR